MSGASNPELDAARARIDELLALIVRITNETPFADEMKEWQSTRAKLLAEIGTLRAERDQLIAYIDDAKRAAGKGGRMSGEPLADFITRAATERVKEPVEPRAKRGPDGCFPGCRVHGCEATRCRS